ncbi:YfiR/HmsC family protein [Falsiroseomonas sp. E2-1-a20]|uniref:YfiR/HmsC family protein n=1 Tax=Falsiroseomonas sp. E2-1-a20 TaxID=3239300 RepID=UPI003F305700
MPEVLNLPRAARRAKAPARAASFLAGVLLAVTPMAARADVSVRDLQVIARAVAFMTPAPSGTVEIGIVYPTASAPGRQEAERIVAAFGGGLRAGSLTLTARPIALESVPSGPVALLLTSAALPQAAAVAAAVAGKGVLTVSTDPAAIEGGRVVMTVRSEPRVEILVNRAAAQGAGVSFSAAFRMMIQER